MEDTAQEWPLKGPLVEIEQRDSLGLVSVAASGRHAIAVDQLPGRQLSGVITSKHSGQYEVVLQEGRPSDILAYVDGALLVDLWDDLVLPWAVRSAWAPLVSPSGKAEA